MYKNNNQNNEIFNILKEQKLYNNLSKKSLGELEKLKQLTTNKGIEEFIKG